MSGVRVTKLQCSKHSTCLTAPRHSFPTGARIQVTGISEILETEIFFADHCSSNSFSLCRNVCAEVSTIEPEKSIIRTKRPHQIPDTHSGVELKGIDPTGAVVTSTYHIQSILDPWSLRLESWCKDTRAMVPADLSRLVEATVGRKHCNVVLGRGSKMVSALASLVHRPSSEKVCVSEWQNALQAARAAGKLPEAPSFVPREPEIKAIPALHVGQCGWDDCQGIFHRSGPLQFNLGPGIVSIVYMDDFKAWCLLAEVAPLYPLCEQRMYLELDETAQAPQLLYIRHSSSVVGQWEPVIGPAPGPEVTVYKEVFVQLSDCSAASHVSHVSPLLNEVGSMVLDLLFNYTQADWSGGIRHGNVWGLSAVEAMLVAVRLWRFMQEVSAVCRTWQQALKPFNNLTKMCYHAMQIKSSESKVSINLPNPPDAAMAIMCAGSSWNDGLKITDTPSFQGRAWPAQVAEIRLLSQLHDDEDHFLYGPTPALLNRLAGTFLQVMRQMLSGIRLAWKTKPYTLGVITTCDGRRFASCDLLEFVRVEDNQCHAYVQTDADGHMRLLSQDGRQLVPHDWRIMLPLLSKGLRLESAVRRWTSSRLQPRGPGEPCGFPFCQKLDTPCRVCQNDSKGRTRLGASQLSGGYTIEFDGPSGYSRKIMLELDVRLIPFFATSQDSSLVPQLGELLPWFYPETESEPWDSPNLEDPKDTRRRLRGKQPPPPAWQD